MSATILDVVDNCFGPEVDLASVPGRALVKLGEEVRRWAEAYTPPVAGPEERPIYIGGWPSANIWDSASGQIALASLLYSGQLVARDPISDWYSNDRYRVPLLMPARPGHLDPETHRPNVRATRSFLQAVLPVLRSMRPLLEAGAIALAPYRQFAADERGAIEAVRDDLLGPLLSDGPQAFCERFRPHELAVEENVRGMFVFAGGNRAEQITTVLARSLEFFAGEYLFATSLGAEYAAPFRFEQYLCAEGIEPQLLASPGARVLHAVLQSELPLFDALSPEVLASVRNDEAFGDFRASLFELYRDVPLSASDGLGRSAIAEAEATLLAPRLERIRVEVERGPLARAGLRFAGPILRMATAIGFDLATGNDPALAAARSGLAETIGAVTAHSSGRSLGGADRIWTRLYQHHRSVNDEVRGAVLVEPHGDHPDSEFWGIPEQPSMQVSVAGGILIDEQLGGPLDLPAVPRNDPCACGSGVKFKHCCLGVDRPRLDD